jgi:signal transduction histidine kinase
MDARLRDRLAIAIAAASFGLGVGALALARFDVDVHLAQGAGGRVFVDSVDPQSNAWREGIRPGMVVLGFNGVRLIELPSYVYADVEPTPDPETGEATAQTPIRTEPVLPLDAPIDPAALRQLLAAPITNLEAIQPWDLERGKPDQFHTVSAFDDFYIAGLDSTLPAVFLGTALLLLGGWWLASGRAGPVIRPLAIPLVVATAVPFLVRPTGQTVDPVLIALGGVATVLAMLPLASALVERIADPEERRVVGIVSGACATIAIVLEGAAAVVGSWQVIDTGLARWALIAAIPLIPGLAAAAPIRPGSTTSSGRLLESTEYAVAGATPLFALATGAPPYLLPLGLWVVFVLVAGRFTVRPLARLATRATLQRDLVVAATEAERARVAADIHDDALQELTLLVHRLDAAGDAEGADIARTVSDRLRAICGDLRLPILDDLGVGPALDWLVLRIERLAGGEVRLERSDGTRPPADVELAFFRVAQEALSNAVKHGAPPIVVRYSTSDDGASLTIDDAGPGIAPDAEGTADRTGHFGLLNMQQRAEAIGAILDVRAWPSGGTHVKLDWRAR